MAHPDLYDQMFQDLLEGFDNGVVFATIDRKRGLVWHHKNHGGKEDALPREQLLIASVLQKFIEESGEAHFENRKGIDGIVFHDENEFIPLNDVGVNKQLGFYKLSMFPDTVNDAGNY